MNMKKMIQTLAKIEKGKYTLKESSAIECGDMGSPDNMSSMGNMQSMSQAMPAQSQGNPVTASLTLNASGMDHVSDLMRLMQQAGLEKAGPPEQQPLPMRQDMEGLRDKMNSLEKPQMHMSMSDEEDLDEQTNPKDLMGQIRKTAKGVETNPDESAHRIFAQQIEHQLISLFQYFDQQRDSEKKEAVRDLIRQNKQAQSQTNLRNANDIVRVLWDLMKANEGWDNEPDEDYQDHHYMLDDLAGGINKPKQMFKPAAKGDNPMALESIKERLYRALAEKKSKPDFPDVGGAGDPLSSIKSQGFLRRKGKKSHMTQALADKALADKKKKSKKKSIKEAELKDLKDKIKRISQDGNDRAELSYRPQGVLVRVNTARGDVLIFNFTDNGSNVLTAQDGNDRAELSYRSQGVSVRVNTARGDVLVFKFLTKSV
jgi:hypothetical protein